MKKLVIIAFISITIICLVVVFVNLMFPRKYLSLIEKYSNEYDLTNSMVASIVNVESGFKKDRVSKAGAIGLMQILPTTAQDCAERLGIDFTERDLYDPETNVKIGCFYLSYLLQMFEGNVVNTLCAYNWGLGNVREWINKGNVDSEGTIINIPIKETEAYIQKYRTNLFIYKQIFKL